MELVLTIAGAVGVVAAALAALTKWVFRPIAQASKRIHHFFEDWFGEPPRPGFPGRQGVMSKLEDLEKRTARTEWHVGNGDPKPLREIAADTAADVEQIKRRLGEVEDTVSGVTAPSPR